jgi:hypothetical protein
MSLKDTVLEKLAGRGLLKKQDIWDFQIDESDIPRYTELLQSDFAKLFLSNEGHQVHKWLHYLDAYDRFFAPYRGKSVNVLEIGVSKGGSLDMWRRYFGPEATIFGIDIDPACAHRVTAPNQVRIGSQDDVAFLKRVFLEMGEIDIIIDDGSHVGRHQIVSFETLFPLLKNGGVYAIEDLHTAYWPGEWEGGYQRPGTAIEHLKLIVDDMHSYYHDKGAKTAAGGWAHSICFYDSITFVEKREKLRPAHIQIPKSSTE